MKKERDPDRLWFECGDGYLIPDGRNYIAVGDGVQITRGPDVLFQTKIVELAQSTHEGVLVKDASMAWFEIVKHLTFNPLFRFEFSRCSRKFEEFIAGAYCEDGWEQVTLTPRSGDRGRDVIAARIDSCPIRVLDQAKARSSRRLVKHDDVRAIVGVLHMDHNASKALITTTSDFAPTIWSNDEFTRLMPNRLELKNGRALLKWLMTIRAKQVVSASETN